MNEDIFKFQSMIPVYTTEDGRICRNTLFCFHILQKHFGFHTHHSTSYFSICSACWMHLWGVLMEYTTLLHNLLIELINLTAIGEGRFDNFSVIEVILSRCSQKMRRTMIWVKLKGFTGPLKLFRARLDWETNCSGIPTAQDTFHPHFRFLPCNRH